MAYILATVSWEATAPITETHKNSKGKVITTHPWRMTWAPVEEVGHGHKRAYEHPVKVFSAADGSIRVTEWDGDQWTFELTRQTPQSTEGHRPASRHRWLAP